MWDNWDSFQLSFQSAGLYILYLRLCRVGRMSLSCISAVGSEYVAPKACGDDEEFLTSVMSSAQQNHHKDKNNSFLKTQSQQKVLWKRLEKKSIAKAVKQGKRYKKQGQEHKSKPSKRGWIRLLHETRLLKDVYVYSCRDTSTKPSLLTIFL